MDESRIKQLDSYLAEIEESYKERIDEMVERLSAGMLSRIQSATGDRINSAKAKHREAMAKEWQRSARGRSETQRAGGPGSAAGGGRFAVALAARSAKPDISSRTVSVIQQFVYLRVLVQDLDRPRSKRVRAGAEAAAPYVG